MDYIHSEFRKKYNKVINNSHTVLFAWSCLYFHPIVWFVFVCVVFYIQHCFDMKFWLSALSISGHSEDGIAIVQYSDQPSFTRMRSRMLDLPLFRGLFLERPGNFSVPKANFKIQTCLIEAQFLAHKPANFSSLTDSFDLLVSKFFKIETLILNVNTANTKRLSRTF